MTENFFPVSERTVRRDWRARYGLKYLTIHGRSVASYDDAREIAEKIAKTAPPAPSEMRPTAQQLRQRRGGGAS